MFFIFAGLAGLPAAAGAGEIEGVKFADRYAAGKTAMVLNGVGLYRYKKIIKAYVGALYLGEKTSPRDVFKDVPKRLELHYFWAIKGPDFGKEADRFLGKNFPPAVLEPLKARLLRLHALYEDVKPGDRYALTYVPGTGMELALNGKVKGVIEGSDFAEVYYTIWLGEKADNQPFRLQLLDIK